MKRTIILLFAALLSFGTAFAKELSVAYIDMQYILKNLPQYEQANEQLTMLSKRWQKEIDAAQQEARVMATNYQTEQIFLSETRRLSNLFRMRYTMPFRTWRMRNVSM